MLIVLPNRCDDAFKAAAYLVEAARSDDKPALNLALRFDEPVFERWSSPQHAWRGQRMGQAMKQLHQMANGNVKTGEKKTFRSTLSKSKPAIYL